MNNRNMKMNLKQCIIVSIILLMLSALFLIVYNCNSELFGIAFDAKVDILPYINFLPFLSGTLYLASVIFFTLSLYYKWKEKCNNKYLISVVMSIVIGILVGIKIYYQVIFNAIANILIIAILVYCTYILFNMQESEFVSPLECITIILIDISILMFLQIGNSVPEQFVVCVIWLLIFLIIYKMMSNKYNNQGLLKTLIIALVILFLVSPILTKFVRVIMSIRFVRDLIKNVLLVSYISPIFYSLNQIIIDVKIVNAFIMAIVYWLFSIKIIRYTYKIYLNENDFSLREYSIIRFNRLFNISVLIVVYILLKIIDWEDMGVSELYYKDIDIVIDALTLLTLIILFTDERLKSSKITKEKYLKKNKKKK